MKNLFVVLFLVLVCVVSLFAQKPQTFTLDEIMQSVKSTGTAVGVDKQSVPPPPTAPVAIKEQKAPANNTATKELPQTFSMQELMQSIKSTETLSAIPQGVTNEAIETVSVNRSTVPMDKTTLAKKIKLAITQLGSTATSTEQSMAKNNLIRFGKQAVPQLSETLLNDKRTWTRVQIARILGNIGDKSAIPALETVSSSKFEVLNKAAIGSIGAIGGTDALASLEKIKAANTDSTISQTIEDAITKAKAK